MLTLILAIIITSPAFACTSFIAESEIPKAIAMEPNAGAKQCDKSDPCVCFDGIDWETAIWSKAKGFGFDAVKAEAKTIRIAREASEKALKDAQVAKDKGDSEAALAKLKSSTASQEEKDKLLIYLIEKMKSIQRVD